MEIGLNTNRTLAIARASFAGAPVASAVLLLFLAFSLWSWYIVYKQHEERDSASFKHQRHRVITTIQNRVQVYQGILKDAFGLFAASRDVNRRKFGICIQHLNIEAYYSGFQGIGFTKLISPERLAEQVEDTDIGFDVKSLDRIDPPVPWLVQPSLQAK